MALSKTQLATVDVELERERPLPKSNRRTDLPVLLLTISMMPGNRQTSKRRWNEVGDLEQALRSQGHPVTNIPVYDSDLESHLKNYRSR